MSGINLVNTLWMMIASILVFFMVCGLALFYAGLVAAKNAVNTMKMSFFAMAVLIFIWVLVGYSLSFSHSNSYIGNFNYIFFEGLFNHIHSGSDIPDVVFAVFQMMFFVIAAALISGAVVERMRFKAFICFTVLWAIIFYTTTVHWVWSENGWLLKLGVIDFAGGFAIHIGAGFSALILAIVLKPRTKVKETKAHNIPFVILGACILWFGYYGFNAGSALGVNKIAFVAFINTATAPSIAILTWVILDFIRSEPSSAINVAIAAVIGLVSITPSAGFVGLDAACLISLITTITCYFAFYYLNRAKVKIDDSLDVFVCHGLSGFSGIILTGVFASSALNPSIKNGLIYGGFDLFFKQLLAAILIAVFAMIVTFLITLLLRLFISLRVSKDEEDIGLDLIEHGESAYENLNHMDLFKRQLYNSLKNKKKQYQHHLFLLKKRK
ncbi:ammonium transporter [Thiotrichales bacterium 19S3-7]|nr:ammonium transporter [Thiotrichales bacterium 19S3-7]MCF6800618.1 ammonium transporter [Thiotrichales bacterium 19S3-11]